MPFPDIFEQTVLTEYVKREWDELAQNPGGGVDTGFDVRQILPLKEMRGRMVKLRVQDVLPLGLANFRAPHQSPALWTPIPKLREEIIEIVDIDEISRIDEMKMLALQSQDPNVFDEGMIGLAELGTDLQSRNELRTTWMGWQALQGILVVTYPSGGVITVNYGIPAGHFPTFGVPWTDLVNSDPVEDMWALGAVALADAGIYLPWFHMNDVTFRQMRRSKKIRDSLSSYGRAVMLPTEADMQQLFRQETEVKIVDSGYLPENASNKLLTKWIADGKIFACPRGYNYAGKPIGDIADGYVLVKPVGASEPQARQGTQSEAKSTDIPPYQTWMRQCSARMPRIYAPESLAWGTAY